MKHSFLINLGKNIDPKYVTWTKETIAEFLELFPEYKDKFEILVYDGQEPRDDYIDLGNKKIKFDSSMRHVEDSLNIKLPEGTHFFSYENDTLSASTEEANYQMWLFGEAAKGNYYHSIGLTNIVSNNNIAGYSSEIDRMIETIDPENLENARKTSHTIMRTHDERGLIPEKLFKDILMHEIGHAFRAGSDDSGIEHCDTPNCLMERGEDNIINKGKRASFCSTCIKNMKNHMSFIFTNNTQTNGSKIKLHVFDSSQDLPQNHELNDEFKKPWRDFAKKLAQKMSWEYEEDEKETNFKAKLKANDGSSTLVCASSKNDVSLSAKDKDGNPKVPDLAVFKELVAKAQKDGSVIDFGDIKTPEFKARLLIACMEANPPMTPENAPALDDNFLVSIDKASAEKIKQLKAKNEENNQDEGKEETPKKTEGKKTPYEESRDERKRLLEAKLKINTITAMEQTELNYIKQEEKRKQAKEEAIARTGNMDPRTAEHTQQSGLSPASYAYNSSSEREWKGWKLHLDVVPNRDNETTRAVSEFLEQLEVDHKIAKGGENGKGMTIYVGGYEDAFKLSKEIKQRFGKDIAEPPIYTDQKGEETDFNNIVTGRFYLQGIFQKQYPRSSVKGICPADYGSLSDRNMESLLVYLAGKEELVDKNYKIQYNIENTNFHDHYTVTNLESYCAHRFYQKHLGEYYCGRDAEGFERRIFGDVIPPKGSDERKKWDKIAKSYANVLEKENPKCLESIQELKRKYKPIDFRKAPQMTQYHKRGNEGKNS